MVFVFILGSFCYHFKKFSFSLLDLKVDKRPVENVEDYEGTWEEESRSPVGKWNFDFYKKLELARTSKLTYQSRWRSVGASLWSR